jgi:hypothetical protein
VHALAEDCGGVSTVKNGIAVFKTVFRLLHLIAQNPALPKNEALLPKPRRDARLERLQAGNPQPYPQKLWIEKILKKSS